MNKEEFRRKKAELAARFKARAAARKARLASEMKNPPIYDEVYEAGTKYLDELANGGTMNPNDFKVGDVCSVNGAEGVVVKAPETTEGVYLVELAEGVFSVKPENLSREPEASIRDVLWRLEQEEREWVESALDARDEAVGQGDWLQAEFIEIARISREEVLQTLQLLVGEEMTSSPSVLAEIKVARMRWLESKGVATGYFGEDFGD